MKNTELQGSQRLYTRIRAAFVAQDTTFNDWCKRHNLTRQWARQAALGMRNGASARDLRQRLAQAAGLLTETD